MLSNDVETTSIWNHCLSDKTGEKVLKEGMPVLLELYEKYHVKATFFFTGHIAQKFPEIVRMILPYGHEVACHGLVHEADKAFDVLTFDQQVEHLKKSKNILENISGKEVISFRAPALRVNQSTPKALAAAGFKIDSSIAPQRADMLFSFGVVKKFNWLVAPRKPYFTSENNLARRGASDIFEIPLSAFLLPYIGTFMRIAPFSMIWLRNILHFENQVNGKPIVFLIHPNELIIEEIVNRKTIRRSKNYISYILGDVLRHKVKLKNLGDKAVPLYEKEVKFFFEKKYEFLCLKDFYEIVKTDSYKVLLCK